jgi:hypothetical protein
VVDSSQMISSTVMHENLIGSRLLVDRLSLKKP